MKRSKTLWFLSLFFAWAALKSLGGVLVPDAVSDYAILTVVGFGAFFFLVNVPLVFAEVGAAILLFRRHAAGYRLAVVAMIVEVINGIVVTAISLGHLEEAKAFYNASREARGMSQRHEQIDMFMTPQWLGLALLAYVAFYVVMFFAVRRVRPELAQHVA